MGLVSEVGFNTRYMFILCDIRERIITRVAVFLWLISCFLLCSEPAWTMSPSEETLLPRGDLPLSGDLSSPMGSFPLPTDRRADNPLEKPSRAPRRLFTPEEDEHLLVLVLQLGENNWRG
jgi:hypothetical protein